MVLGARCRWLFAALGLVCACQGKRALSADDSDTRTTARAGEKPRLDLAPRQRIGAQPGYIDGGVVFASVRARKLQTFAQTLPLPPLASRWIGRLSAGVELDLQVDDFVAHTGLADDAVISMTLFRPLSQHAESIRSQLARGGGLLAVLAKRNATSSGDESTPNDLVEQGERVANEASTLGAHSRVFIPTTAPSRWIHNARALWGRDAYPGWGRICNRIKSVAVCLGDRDRAVIIRETQRGIAIDILWFFVQGSVDETYRVGAAMAAMSVPASGQSILPSLSGDAAAFVDATAVPRLANVQAIGRALTTLQWTDSKVRDATLDRRLEEVDALGRQMEAPVLFDGLTLEFGLTVAAVEGSARWHIAQGKDELAATLLQPTIGQANVPKLSALCDGSIACARTGGLPQPSKLSDALAIGLYAEDENTLLRTLSAGHSDQMSALLVASATWPNLLGAVSRWPAQDVGRGPEAAIIKQAVDALGRLEGSGGSIRTLEAHDQRTRSTYAVFARATAQDIDLIRNLAVLADLPATGATWEGLPGALSTFQPPTGAGGSSTFVTYVDPLDSAHDPGYGWAAAVDAPERFRWLIGLPREKSDSSLGYGEVADLWDLLAPIWGAKTLNFAKSWLKGRSMQAEVTFERGAPRLDLAIRYSRGSPSSGPNGSGEPFHLVQ